MTYLHIVYESSSKKESLCLNPRKSEEILSKIVSKVVTRIACVAWLPIESGLKSPVKPMRKAKRITNVRSPIVGMYRSGERKFLTVCWVFLLLKRGGPYFGERDWLTGVYERSKLSKLLAWCTFDRKKMGKNIKRGLDLIHWFDMSKYSFREDWKILWSKSNQEGLTFANCHV